MERKRVEERYNCQPMKQKNGITTAMDHETDPAKLMKSKKEGEFITLKSTRT